MRMIAGGLGVLLFLGAGGPAAAPDGGFTLRKVLLTGETAPGIEPALVDEVGDYVSVFNPDPFAAGPSMGLGGIGLVARHGGDGDPATADGTGSGVWRWAAGSLQLAALEGQAAPGTPGWPFTGFPSFSAATPFDHGDGVAFAASVLAGDGSERFGLWSTRGGTLARRLLDGEPLPGAPAGTTASPRFAFVARGTAVLVEAGWCFGGGCAFRDEGLFRDRDGSLVPVVRRGDPAPGFGPGAAFDDYGNASANTGPVHLWNGSPDGRVILNGYVRGPRIDAGNNEGLWAEGSAGLVLLAREGDRVPGRQGYRWGAASGFQGFGDPTTMRSHMLTSTGRALWGASIHNGRYNRINGVWTNRTGQVTQVVQTVRRDAGIGGQPPQSLATPAPGFGPGHSFRQVFAGRMNAQGEVYFDADVAEDAFPENPDPQSGVFHVRPGSNAIELLAGRGTPVPSLPGATFREVRIGRLFETGHYLWLARVQGEGIGAANDLGAFLTLPGGATLLLFRTGEAIDVAGDGVDLRTLADFNADADPRGGGDVVEQVFELRFTDGSAGAFVGRLP